MPKKTKREKIIADYRKKLQRVQQLHPSSPVRTNPSSSPPKLINTFSFTARAHTSGPAARSDSETELAYIKHDLAKTLMLAMLAIAGEFALFWFWKG